MNSATSAFEQDHVRLLADDVERGEADAHEHARDGGDGADAFGEDAQHDGGEERRGGEPEGERHDLADEARRVDAEVPGDAHRHADGDPADQQPLRFAGAWGS